ncbi:MAG: helix-turn-helix transcriptional regulator [Pseudonocardiaceae bacterium]
MVVKRRSFAQARRAAGFTQESLAERLGVDRTTVARWESGEYSPQPWLRPRTAAAFGVSLGGLRELVDVAGEPGTTGHAAGVSTALIKVDDVPPAGHTEMADAKQDHDQLSQALELAGAYAGMGGSASSRSAIAGTVGDRSTGCAHRASDPGSVRFGCRGSTGRRLGRVTGVARLREQRHPDNSCRMGGPALRSAQERPRWMGYYDEPSEAPSAAWMGGKYCCCPSGEWP